MSDASDTSSPLRVEEAGDGFVRVVFEHLGAPVNRIDGDVLAALDAILSRFESKTPAGVVFSTAREHFCVGADVNLIAALPDRDAAEKGSRTGQDLFERLEALRCPTVAAVRGTCLGGGLEWALACDRIVAADAPDTRLGLPEVQLGILPAWGGSQRLPMRIGLGPAVEMMATGRRLPAAAAAKRGLVDRVVPPNDLDAAALEEARRLAQRHRDGRVPRVSRRGLVGGLARLLPPVRALVFGQVRKAIRRKAGKHYPAPLAIVEAVETSFVGDRPRGLAKERALFAELALGSVSRNLVGLFFLTQEAKGWYGDEAAAAGSPVGTIAVLGAGIMGAGIARLAAENDHDVVLRDVAEAPLTTGMDRIRRELDKRVERRRLTAARRDAIVARIRPTTELADIAGVDLVIEAVIENLELKRKVLAEAEAAAPGALLASNTSALPIGDMASALSDPGKLAGLHFFNPVDRMPLVEVIAAPSSAVATVGAMVSLVRRLGKTPVRVTDTPGFLVNRLLSIYLGEALLQVEEGVDIVALDRALRAFGMPMGPCELLDQVGLDVAAEVTQTLTAAFPDRLAPTDLLARMVEAGRTGAKGGLGFYRHGSDRPAPDREGLEKLTGRDGTAEPPPDVVARLIDPMLAEAVRCLDERVVEQPAEVDLALVMGIGWPPFTGGLLRWADQTGLEVIAERLDRRAETEGVRVEPPASLVARAGAGERFRPAANGVA